MFRNLIFVLFSLETGKTEAKTEKKYASHNRELAFVKVTREHGFAIIDAVVAKSG